jgi:predicted ABC-type ATPase
VDSDPTRDVVIVGGPNGAGKTTWAVKHLSAALNIREFVNADEISRGLSPLDPEASALAAGRLMLERLDALVDAGASFAFETTCAGRGHVKLLNRCRGAGYFITLVFLWLPSGETAQTRVAQRITQGGHRIPNDVILRRYAAGLRNMRHLYLPLADMALIYDNSDRSDLLIASRQMNSPLIVHDQARWSRIEELTR